MESYILTRKYFLECCKSEVSKHKIRCTLMACIFGSFSHNFLCMKRWVLKKSDTQHYLAPFRCAEVSMWGVLAVWLGTRVWVVVEGVDAVAATLVSIGGGGEAGEADSVLTPPSTTTMTTNLKEKWMKIVNYKHFSLAYPALSSIQRVREALGSRGALGHQGGKKG